MYAISTLTLRAFSTASFLLAFCHFAKGQKTCGDYYDVSGIPFGTGTFESPGWPTPYPARSDCRWLVYGPPLKTISLFVLHLDGESSNGVCLDFLEVRAGSSASELLYKGCSIPTNLTIETPNRWLWVKFQSDEAVSGIGFHAIWRTTDNLANVSYARDPVISCGGPKFSCRNRECASYAYSCDGFNDCGCTGEGCDETPCPKSYLNNSIKFAIGVSIGFAVTTVAVMLTYTSERVNPWPPFQKKTPEPTKKRKR